MTIVMSTLFLLVSNKSFSLLTKVLLKYWCSILEICRLIHVLRKILRYFSLLTRALLLSRGLGRSPRNVEVVRQGRRNFLSEKIHYSRGKKVRPKIFHDIIFLPPIRNHTQWDRNAQFQLHIKTENILHFFTERD